MGFLQCGILTYHEGASTFVSCPSTPTLATCNLATPAFDPTKHFVPDDAYDQCKVYTTLSGIVSPVTPKTKQYHVAANTSTSGLTSYLDSNNYCTSEGWEFGTIMSLDDVDDYITQISEGEFREAYYSDNINNIIYIYTQSWTVFTRVFKYILSIYKSI